MNYGGGGDGRSEGGGGGMQRCNVENMVHPKAGLSRFGSASVLLRTFVRCSVHPSSLSKVDYFAAETAHLKFHNMFELNSNLISQK